MNAPCYNCQECYIGCHSKCLKYIDFVQAQQVKKEKVTSARMQGYLTRSLKRDSCEKARKRHRHN